MKTYLALTIACLSLQGVSVAEAQPPQQPRYSFSSTLPSA